MHLNYTSCSVYRQPDADPEPVEDLDLDPPETQQTPEASQEQSEEAM